MKTRLLPFLLMLISSVALALPNERVLKNFNLTFPKADSIVWYESEAEYGVYFINDGIKCRMWYDLEGNVKKSLRYFGEEKLPPIIIGNLQRKYPGTKVFGVTEVSTPEEFTYQVVLEGEKNWLNVNADPVGNLRTISKLNKGK